MKAVFLDTVGLLAIWDENDQWHRAAQPVYEQMLATRKSIVTSEFVLLECGNAASRRPYRSAVIRFRDEMWASGRVVNPTEQDCQSAWINYTAGNVSGAGIVDHVSFVIMRRLGITDAFTNDRHFKAAGFFPLF